MNELNELTVLNTRSEQKALKEPAGRDTDAVVHEARLYVAASITVVVNGTPETTVAPTLQAWIDALSARGVLPAALATAVNGHFVPRNLRAQQPLAEGDTILTFQPIQGG